ncbi:MAG: UPF0182 family protein [Methanomicrobiaceae archaeon]|nr:UPF0182 family protein [Methanomicrobiaceae archaeon]
MNRPLIAGIIVVAAITVIAFVFGFLGDWFWFSSVGYEPVLLTITFTKVLLWIGAFLIFSGIALVNVSYAAKSGAWPNRVHKGSMEGVTMVVLIAGALAATVISGSWEIILKYLHQTPFGTTDPIFGIDIGFYVFILPFYSLIVNFILAIILFSTIVSVIAFFFNARIVKFRTERGRITIVEGDEEAEWSSLIRRFLPHASFLLFLLFLAISAYLWLRRYNLLYSTTGAVFGAGYTDVHVTLPVLSVLSVVALLIGIGFLVNQKFRRVEILQYGVLAFAAIAIIGFLAGGVTQALVVQPNEYNLEEPYLAFNIQHTLDAYGLSDASERPFPVEYNLTAEDIAENRGTVDNIRLWDWRPLRTTYQQLQLFRTYYAFYDVDVDRYTIDGMYKEVLVSAREMEIENLPVQAQTWVNRHLVYTHGYGVVMNPVDQVSGEGLPVFYISDIPPNSSYFSIDQPRIYFGDGNIPYAITGTSTDEFDYPSGEQNIYSSYDGKGGVELSDGLRKFVYATRFGSVELLVSGSLTPESRILMHRNVRERIGTIAPFLSYDPDPYIVVEDGRLFWIIDAYTTTDRYPYSEWQWAAFEGRVNYIRNSVKVVVDAYHGDVSYYVIDPDDPLIQTYQQIFPGLFREIDEMPVSLRSHLRYPEGLFGIQATVYSTYHMKNPNVFYNKEDIWVVPDEIYRGSRRQMEPYYVIMKLPGEEKEEFILMIPFTPRNKENLIGWMAARSDLPKYGNLAVFQFSKQELTYGPMQIEARIDQDPEISQLITLWSQSGSSVLRGNTLVIPIESSIIYVEPLYLEATERGTLPQLQRVIVAYHDRLTMQNTLNEAISGLFGEGPDGEVPGPIGDGETAVFARIAELYMRAQEALKRGDLGLYQEYIDQIGEIVTENMGSQTK